MTNLIVFGALAVVLGAVIVALMVSRRRPRGTVVRRPGAKTPPAVRRARASQKQAMRAHRRGRKAFRR